MNEKFNKNAKVEKLTKKVGRGVRLIVIGPYDFCFIPHIQVPGNCKRLECNRIICVGRWYYAINAK